MLNLWLLFLKTFYFNITSIFITHTARSKIYHLFIIFELYKFNHVYNRSSFLIFPVLHYYIRSMKAMGFYFCKTISYYYCLSLVLGMLIIQHNVLRSHHENIVLPIFLPNISFVLQFRRYEIPVWFDIICTIIKLSIMSYLFYNYTNGWCWYCLFLCTFISHVLFPFL